MNRYMLQPHKSPLKVKAHSNVFAVVRTLGIFSRRLCPPVMIVHCDDSASEVLLNKIQRRLKCSRSFVSMSHYQVLRLARRQCHAVLRYVTGTHSCVSRHDPQQPKPPFYYYICLHSPRQRTTTASNLIPAKTQPPTLNGAPFSYRNRTPH